MVRIPLILLFVALIAVTLLCIGSLVFVLDKLLADEATRSAKAAIHGALQHASEIVAAPFDESVMLVRRSAVDVRVRQDRFDNPNRTTPESMLSMKQQYLATINASRAPLYAVYQGFMVGGDNSSWTYSGCFGQDHYCLWYRNNGYFTTDAQYPDINLTIQNTATGVSTWNYTDDPFIARARVLSIADKAGKWQAPGIWYDQELKKTVSFITFNVPAIFDDQGRALVLESIDLRPDGFKEQLYAVKLPDTKVILIHTEQRTVLATTYDIPAFSFKPERSSSQLWLATETPSDELNKAAKYLASTEDAIIMSDDVIYGVHPLVRETLRLTVMTVTDKAFFFTTLRNARIIGICIGIGCGCVCAVLAIAITFLIQRALRRLRDAMVPASRLQMDPAAYSAQGVSFVSDIATLQQAFGVMNEKLHEAGSYLPQSVKVAWAALDNTDPFDECDDADTHNSPDKNSPLDSSMKSATPHSAGDFSFSASTSSRSGRRRPHTAAAIPPVPTIRVHNSSSPAAPSEYTVLSTLTNASSNAPYLKVHRNRLRCTVLQVNLRGFQRATTGVSYEEVALRSAVLTDIVISAAQENKGVLDTFQGDHYTIVFNAVAPCPAHTRRAVACARTIEAALAESSETFDLPVSCGIAVGTALVGDIGSQAMRRFGILGPVVGQAAMLERLCRRYDNSMTCLVSQSSFDDLSCHFAIASVDYVRLPGAKHACLIGAVVGEFSEERNDEWLYVVEDGHAKDVLGCALTAAAFGEDTAARELLTQHDSTVADDGKCSHTVAQDDVAATARMNIERILSEPAFNTKQNGRRLEYLYDCPLFEEPASADGPSPSYQMPRVELAHS